MFIRTIKNELHFLFLLSKRIQQTFISSEIYLSIYSRSLCSQHFNQTLLVFIYEMCLNCPILLHLCTHRGSMVLRMPHVKHIRTTPLLSQLHQSPSPLVPCVGHSISVTNLTSPHSPVSPLFLCSSHSLIDTSNTMDAKSDS